MKKKLTVHDMLTAARQHAHGITLDNIKTFYLPEVSRQTIWRAVREVRATEARLKLATSGKHPGLLTLGETILALQILDQPKEETEAAGASPQNQ